MDKIEAAADVPVKKMIFPESRIRAEQSGKSGRTVRLSLIFRDSGFFRRSRCCTIIRMPRNSVWARRRSPTTERKLP